MRYLNAGLVVAVLSAAAMLVDGSRSGAAAQPSPNPIVVAQTVEARKAEADRLFQQGNQKRRTNRIELAGGLTPLCDPWEYLRREKYPVAIKCFQQSLEDARKTGNRELEMSSLYGLGWIYDDLGNYQQAVELYEKALKISRSVSNRYREADLLNLLGWTYYNLGQYQMTIDLNQQSIAISQSIDYLFREGYSLIDTGLAYRNLKKLQAAEEFVSKALSIAEKENNAELRAFGLRDLGFIYQDMGEYEKAIDCYQASIRISQSINRLFWQANGLNALGGAFLSIGEYQKALDAYQTALEVSQERGYRAMESSAFDGIANLMAKQNQPELAIVFYKQSVNVREAIRQDIRKLDRTLQESYTQSIAGTYRRLADLLLAQGRVLEAQQVLELLKIQELRDFSRDTRAGGDTNGSPLTPRESTIPPAFSDKIALGQKLTACESQRPRCPERESLQNQLKTANTTFNQLADRLRTQQATKDPAQLQRDELTRAAQKVVLAQPKTVLIYPLVLEDKLWLVWGSQAGSKGVVFDSQEVRVSRKELSATVLRFRQLLERPGDVKELQQVSQKLYGWLIAPIRPQLDANGIQNLVFSLDRATRYIPMAALHDGQHYLVEKFALSTILTSGTTDTSEKLAANPATTKVLGMGLSNAVSGLNPLPSVVDELNGIIRSQPADRTGIFPGSKFLNQTFDRRAFQDLIDYRILHIATHGKFVSGQPEDSFLVLGNGDPLRIPEIKSMTDLNAIHLVVLSACETAKGGEDKEGLEVSGLSYYFITSGAKAVIASLWLVNDASTSLLMQRFYKNLASGTLTKAEALRQVQRDFIDGKLSAKDAPNRSDIEVRVTDATRQIGAQTFAHPYYWTPFILIGNSL